MSYLNQNFDPLQDDIDLSELAFDYSLATVGICFLGHFRIYLEHRPIPKSPIKVQELLLVLCTSESGEISRTALASILWPEADEERSRFYLRRALSQLRSMMGSERDRVISTDSNTVALHLDLIRCDLRDFVALSQKLEGPAIAKAVELYRGGLPNSFNFDWARAQRKRLGAIYVDLVIKLSQVHLSTGQFDAALKWLSDGRKAFPADPALVQATMRTQAAKGDLAGVLKTVRDYRGRAQGRENAVQSNEIVALYRQLMEDRRLVASADFSGSQTSEGTALPSVPTAFFGRVKECETVIESLHLNRVTTLIGFGGVGKSRIAVQCASESAEFFDQISYLSVSESANWNDLVGKFAQALGAPEILNQPLEKWQFVEKRNGKRLLVLDGAEILATAVARIVDRLLGMSPSLHFLITSRVGISILAENIVPVQPLPLPSLNSSAEELARCDSVAFLLTRAASAAPRFQLNHKNAEFIAQICRKLDGLPLALELVASRLRTMSAANILDALNDRFNFLSRSGLEPARSNPLKAILELSASLLSTEEGSLLVALSVFPGTFSPETVAAICTEDFSGQRKSTELLAQLVDHSLIEFADDSHLSRYRLLETVRFYALERLKEDSRRMVEIRNRFAMHFLKVARSIHPAEPVPMNLEAEHSNFSWAIEHFLACPEGSERLLALDVVNRLFPVWQSNRRLAQGISLAYRAMEELEFSSGDSMAECLVRTASAAHTMFNLKLAGKLYGKAATMADRLRLEEWKAEAIRGQADVLADQGHFEDARRIMEGALEQFELVDDELGRAQCLRSLGYYARTQLKFEQAISLTQEAMKIYLAYDDRGGWLWCAGSLAAAYLMSDRPDLALPMFQNVLRETIASKNIAGQVWNMISIGKCLSRLGRHEEAIDTIKEAIAKRSLGQNDLTLSWHVLELGRAYRRSQQHQRATETLLEALSLCRETGSRSMEAESLLSLAEVAIDIDDEVTADVYAQLARQIVNEIQSESLNKLIAEFDLFRQRPRERVG